MCPQKYLRPSAPERRIFFIMDFQNDNLSTRAQEILHESLGNVEEKKIANISELIERPYFSDGALPLLKTEDYLQASSGWVYACAGVISDEVANIKLKLYQKTKSGDIKEMTTHPILDVLYKANNFTTKFDLFWLTQNYLELTGEAPWWVNTQNGVVTDILLLRPDLITVLPGTGNNMVNGYKYKVAGGKELTLEPDEVVFIKYPDPVRAFRGCGTLRAAAKTVDIDNFSEDFNRNFFYNSAMPGSALKTDQKLTAETKKYLEHAIKKLYKGTENAHKTIILESGLDWQPMQLSQKDMDFLEQQRFSRDKILGIFRVPRTALGITDDVNRANAEATDYVFAKRTIRPKMQRLIEQLNEFFVPLFSGSENLFLDFEDPVPKDVTSKIAYYQAGLASGFLTINEVREMENFESIGDEGDTVYLPFSLQPIGDAGNVTQTPPEKSLKNKMTKYLSGRTRKARVVQAKKEDIEKKIAEKLEPIVRQMLGAKSGVKKKSQETDKTINQKFWEVKVAKAAKFEKIWAGKMNNIFDDQSNEVRASMGAKATKEDIDKWLLDKKKQIKKMAKVFIPLGANVVAEGAKEGFNLIGMDDEIDVSNPKVQQFLKKNTFKFSDEITDETNTKLGKTLADGIEKGESIPELKKRVGELFDDMKSYRSERIARSEVIKATNWGTEEAYRESGVVDGKIWLTAFDERTCPYCSDLDGKTVDLGENFADKGDEVSGYKVEYDNVGVPPLHPNCRCTIIPQIKS